MVVTDFAVPAGCKQALALSAGLFFALALTGCHKPSAAAAPPAPPPPQVSVAHPLEQETVDYDEFTARLSAVDSVEIRARVSGYLEKVNFKDGAEVKKGDLLFVIDPRPYQDEVDRLQAELDRANTAVALAQNDSQRAQQLFEGKAISAEEMDTRSKNYASAEAAQKSAQANLEAAQLNLSYTNITAPIDGRLGRAIVTEGNLVTGGGDGANGSGGGNSTLLTTLVSVDPVYAYADVDEATVVKYQQLDKDGLRKNNSGVISAELALGNSDVFSHQGHIDFINNQIDPATGTLQARAIFPNADRTLIPGEFGRLRVIGSGKYQALLIPDYAIGNDQDKKIVYVVQPDHTIATRNVVPGRLVNGLRVIRSGLSPNDLVVLDRLQIVRPGMTVSPKTEPIQSGAASASVATP